jgi:tryptophan 2-monooxygenase
MPIPPLPPGFLARLKPVQRQGFWLESAALSVTDLSSYIDSPEMNYGAWLNALGSNPIGTYKGAARVAVIGAGPSGCAAAYELARAGVNVDVYENGSQVGGRCNSVPSSQLDPKNIVELGAMRFPGSEFILSHYMKQLGLADNGIDGLDPFPDPGKVPTWVCWGGESSWWIDNDKDKSNPPPGFETVYNGWLAFAVHGIMQKGKYVFFNPDDMTRWMQGKQAKVVPEPPLTPEEMLDAIVKGWQSLITAFQGRTFYTVLHELFTGTLRAPNGEMCDIPNGNKWSFEDFDKFGTVGIGSGGFGALYPIGFVEIYRIILNGLENQQKFFPPGIRQVSVKLQQAATDSSKVPGKVNFVFNTPIAQITGEKPKLRLTPAAGTEVNQDYACVIVATTTRSMELNTNLTVPKMPLLQRSTQSAIRRTHSVSSVKVAARIKNFWSADAKLPRVLQCDTTACQAYTLDYDATIGDVKTGVCFISYTWDDDAIKEHGIAPLPGQPYTVDAKKLYDYLVAKIHNLNLMVADPANPKGPQINWASLLQAYKLPNETDEAPYHAIVWQCEPYFNGGFKLSQPGQDKYVADMYWQYKTGGSPSDKGVFLAGDTTAWTSGWVEGGLQTGLNAVVAAILSLGGELTPTKDVEGRVIHTPLDAYPRYNYFPSD